MLLETRNKKNVRNQTKPRLDSQGGKTITKSILRGYNFKTSEHKERKDRDEIGKKEGWKKKKKKYELQNTNRKLA